MQTDKTKIIRLLKTVKGQIEGLIKMIEEERYCIDVSTQILASQSILKKINLEILKGHFTHCIREAFENGSDKDKEEKMSEIAGVLDKLLK